jgi:26S proteasome non-ATPase regulatory subunit 10
MIRLLLKPPPPKNGATREKTRVNPADRIGNTPLHLAMDSGHGSTTVLLIEEGGADRDRVNQDGQRPLEMQGTNEIEQKKVLDFVRSRVG